VLVESSKGDYIKTSSGFKVKTSEANPFVVRGLRSNKKAFSGVFFRSSR
jgi:hypothetical protein